MILFNSAFGCGLFVHFLTLQGADFVIYKRGLQHHMTIAWGIDNPQQISFLTFLWLPVIIFFLRMLNSPTPNIADKTCEFISNFIYSHFKN